MLWNQTRKVLFASLRFLRRAIALLSIAKPQHHHIRLNANFRSDMTWWKIFAAHWNGRALIIPQGPPDLTITSDASGSWGCGAWCTNSWFQLQWSQETLNKHISVKERISIVIAAIVWGHTLNRQRVLCNCDNSAVVVVINTRYSKDKDLMQLLRCLFLRRWSIAQPLTCISHKTSKCWSLHYSYTFFSSVVVASAANRLDLFQLNSSVRHYCDKRVAESTSKTYQSALWRCTTFCSLFSIVSRFPASES